MSSTTGVVNVCHVTWWHAGGLHIHVTHPEGDTERFVYPADRYWQVDAIVREMEQTYGPAGVEVNDRGRRLRDSVRRGCPKTPTSGGGAVQKHLLLESARSPSASQSSAAVPTEEKL